MWEISLFRVNSFLLNFDTFEILKSPISGSKGGRQGRPSGSKLFQVRNFHATTNLKNNRLVLPPPPENPGSATVIIRYFFNLGKMCLCYRTVTYDVDTISVIDFIPLFLRSHRWVTLSSNDTIYPPSFSDHLIGTTATVFLAFLFNLAAIILVAIWMLGTATKYGQRMLYLSIIVCLSLSSTLNFSSSNHLDLNFLQSFVEFLSYIMANLKNLTIHGVGFR